MLVGAHLRGDTDAFSIIVDDHYEVLVTRARRMLGSGGQIEDAVQETFERALRNISKFGLTGEYRLGAWLNRILTNVCSDQRASINRDLRLARISGEARYQADVADQVSDPTTAASVEAAFQGLPATLHTAFVRHALDGMPYGDLAAAENISIENARARVHRARTSLRRSLSGIKAAEGSFLSLPFIGRVFRAGEGPKLASAGQRSWRHLFSLGNPASGSASFGGSGGAVSSFIDRVASQLTVSQIGQTAMAIVSSVPRGTLVFGLAATAATVSVSAVTLMPSDVSSNPGASAPMQVVQAADIVPLPSPSPPPTPPTQQAAAPTATNSAYSWVNAGLGGSSTSSGNTPAAAGLPASACPSADGITPPGSGFSVASPLGLDDAVSIANASSQPLLTAGQYLAFDSRAQLSPFGSSLPPGGEGTVSSLPPSTAVNLDIAMCLSAATPWLTAQMTGAGSTALELDGTLAEVLGTAEDSAYIFRGVVSGQSGDPGSAPETGSQFVAQVTVVDSHSTAQPEPLVQLTVVFLTATSATTSDPTSAAASTSDAASASASATTSTSTSTSAITISSTAGPEPSVFDPGPQFGLTDASSTDLWNTGDALNTEATFWSPSLGADSELLFSETSSWSWNAESGSTTGISPLLTG